MSVSAELLAAVQVAVDALEDPSPIVSWRRDPATGVLRAFSLESQLAAAATLRRYFLSGCPGCGLPLEGHVRKGQRYHSQACRVRAWRARRSAAATPYKAVTGAS